MSRKLRIGIDGRELEGRPTGVGRYLRSLLRRFQDHGGHTFLVYSQAPVSLPAEAAGAQPRVLQGGPPLLWEQRILPAAARADGVDVLFSPAYSCPLFAAMPRVTAIHDLSFFARPEEFGFTHGLRRRMMARWSARVSHSVLAFSEFTRGEIRRRLGPSAADKTSVIFHGTDDDLPPPPDRASSRKALGLEDGVAYVITVGTILRRRNVGVLVRAVARLRDQGFNVQLGIVGENRSRPFADLGALARSLGCEASVRLLGFVSDEDIARHYAAADAAVFLSEYEGFGLPALEAMSRGVPTLISDRGSQNELFASGTLAIEPDNQAVAEALGKLLADPSASAELRRLGLERAKAFSWDRAARETLAVLEKAVS